MANKFQIKRTSVSARTPNTTNSANSSYIDQGELAINTADGKLFSSNGSALIEFGVGTPVYDANGDLLTTSYVNLTSLTAIDKSIIPASNNTYSIGNNTLRWLDLYMSGNGYMYVGSNVTVNSSAIFIGNSTVNTTITAGNVHLQGTQLTVGNTVINGSIVNIDGVKLEKHSDGYLQVKDANNTLTKISAKEVEIGDSDARVKIMHDSENNTIAFRSVNTATGATISTVRPDAATLEGNTVSNILASANTAANTLANNYAATAYSNAVLYAASVANAAYSNAVTYVETYAPSKSGSGATGSWAISITGNAATVGSNTVTDILTSANTAANTLANNYAASAYSNAASYAATIAGTAYSNAVSYAATIAGTAYSNATAYTDTAIANLVDSSPAALNTLNELAAALGDDANFATTVTNGIANAYSNAVSYAATIAGTAYSNAVTYADSITSIRSADTRDSNYAPSDRNRGLYADFKANSTDGLSDGGTYHGVLTFRSYGNTTDFSGGQATQIAYTDSGNLWHRLSSNTSTWGSWKKVLDSSNYNSYAPTLTGTGASGTWSISISGNAATATSANTAGLASVATNATNATLATRATLLASGGSGDFGAYLYTSNDGNLNTYNSPGLYSSEYTGSSNSPYGVTGQNGHWIQISDSGGTDVKTQWYYHNGGNDIWMRLMWGNGVWKTWRKLLHDGNYSSYALPLTGGTLSGALNFAGMDQGAVLQHNGNASQWYGRILTKNSTSDLAAFLGTYASIAGVFAHNNALNAWADLYVNTSDGVNGGTVRTTTSVLMGGNQALHAGNYSSYALPLSGGTLTGTLTLHGQGSNQFANGPSDGATPWSSYNFYLSGWNGMGFYNPTSGGAYPNSITGLMDFRNGILYMRGSHRAPLFYDQDDTGYYVNPAGYSSIGALVRTQTRVDTNEKYPLGHYTPGITVFEIDPTWSEAELRAYFNSNSVSWTADSTAPGGYAIRIDGAVNVGGNYGSGFPYIPVDTDDTFYMECWIKSVDGSQGHYMGSIDYNHEFSSLGGNPGSFGYWTMSNTTTNTDWQKVTGYISGFGASTGQFVSGTKYWTPQALFNYSTYSGTRACIISGWKVYKLARGIVGRFPQSTTNSGEAWYGRANDRNRGTFTVQLGGGSSSGREFEVVDYAWTSVLFKVDSTSYTSAAGSIRSPIFYDSNNTGYYVDPYSTSNIYTLITNNYIDNASHLYERGNIYVLNAAANGWNMVMDRNGGNSYILYGGDSIRAPVFYDSNDTGYYIDPHSTSNSALRMRGGALFGPNVTWGAYLYVGTDGRAGTDATVCVTNGNLHLDSKNGYQMYLNWYSTENIYSKGNFGVGDSSASHRLHVHGTGYATSDFRAPIFYDSNDTAYYVNPNSASVFNDIRAANGNTQIASGNTGQNTKWRALAGSTDVGISVYNAADTWCMQLYANAGSEYGFLNGNWASWDLRKVPNGNLYMNNNNSYYLNAPSDNFMYRVYGAADIRSPIFYDYDNTGYYTDPASTSRINSLETLGSDSTVFGGYFSSNHYNSISTARISFGGGNDFGNYHLGVNRENYGGDYTKLDLRWHTGIRLGAQISYGGIRFFDSEDLGTLRFHIEGTSGYIYKYVWMYINTSGFYSDTNGAHWYPNTSSSYGAWRTDGSRNGWYGISLNGGANSPHIMFDTSGGGLYSEALGRWMVYHSYGNNCLGINASTTSSSYALYVTGAIYSTSNIVAYSDKRVKENVKPIENALETVDKLQGVRYNKIGQDKTEIGFLAQDVEEHLPEVVTYAEDVDQYGVSYGNITALLVEAVKELSAEVKRLKEKLGE